MSCENSSRRIGVLGGGLVGAAAAALHFFFCEVRISRVFLLSFEREDPLVQVLLLSDALSLCSNLLKEKYTPHIAQLLAFMTLGSFLYCRYDHDCDQDDDHGVW